MADLIEALNKLEGAFKFLKIAVAEAVGSSCENEEPKKSLSDKCWVTGNKPHQLVPHEKGSLVLVDDVKEAVKELGIE